MATNETIRTNSGVEIKLSDSRPNIVLSTPGGTQVVVDEASVEIIAAGSRIKVSAGTVIIDAAQVQIAAPMVTASMIRCDTIIATNVVGTTYTPGVGNLM